MKFVMLIYQGTAPLPGSQAWETLSEVERQAIYADYASINRWPGVTPGLPLGLSSSARTVKVADGELRVKNGPHLAESPGGYLVLDAETLEAAVAIAARVPAARLGGAVEIRPAGQYG
jgi:hypothetical protein